MREVTLDREILADFHSAGSDLRALANVAEAAGDTGKAHRYRRIGEMLDGIAYRVRDPLLAAAFRHTERGNTKIERARDLERLGASEVAVYLLVVNDRQKLRRACSIVAKRTGTNAETLRNRFKGLSIADYRNSPQGRRSAIIFETCLRQNWPNGVGWQQAYEFFVTAAAAANSESMSNGSTPLGT